MAEALKTFREGEDILASETNENNQFLLSKLSDNAAQVQNYVESEVASIKSNVSSVQATLQNNLDEFVEKYESGVGSSEIYVIGFKTSGNSWCKTWSNGWKEQGGYDGAVGAQYGRTITFIESFKDTNYMIQLTVQSGIGAGDGGWAYVDNKSTKSANISHYGACAWYAYGF